MTIKSINVSECKHFNSKKQPNCSIYKNECCSNFDCYYKQLKRMEQKYHMQRHIISGLKEKDNKIETKSFNQIKDFVKDTLNLQ